MSLRSPRKLKRAAARSVTLGEEVNFERVFPVWAERRREEVDTDITLE